MRSRLVSIVLSCVLCLAACGLAHRAFAQEHTSATPAAIGHDPHPVFPAPQPWHAITVILIVSMFLAAAAVGVMVRLNSWDEEIPPPAHSHDEPPGSSHHHGRSGTVNPEPEDDLPHHGHHH